MKDLTQIEIEAFIDSLYNKGLMKPAKSKTKTKNPK